MDFAPWVALAFLLAALAACLGAILARALFVMCMYVIACGALVSGAIALLGNGEAALVVALVFSGFAPVLLLALILLSARTTKAQRQARPWLSIGAAIAVALVVLWSTPDIGVSVERYGAGPDAVGAWLAPLVFVAAIVFVALLGYGERGALQRGRSADTDL